MGLCVSMLQKKAKKRQPEPRRGPRGTPKALCIVRSDRRSSKPEALVLQAHDSGLSQLQKPDSGLSQLHKPVKADTRKHEKCRYGGTDMLDRRFCTPKPRLPCGSTRSVTVEPVAPEGRLPTSRCSTTTDRGAPPEWCRTPTTPMTPMRPLWQRRILMGMRCELPRFSGLILYDEHGRPLQITTPGRRSHHQGKKKTTRTSTTLRDLL